jgi:hypothetical protein
MNDEKRKPGRPRLYTPEEAKERRRAQNRERARIRRSEDPEYSKKQYASRSADKNAEYRQRAYQKRKERLQTDPEYRETWNRKQREYRASRKETE